MNKIVIAALVGFSFVVGLYLVSFVTAGNVDVPHTAPLDAPHHAPNAGQTLDVPHGDHTGVPMVAPTDAPFPCNPSDVHRTDAPLDVPTDAPQAERDKMKDYLDHISPGAPLTGTFPCEIPATS